MSDAATSDPTPGTNPARQPRGRWPLLTRVIVILGILVVLGFLFERSLQDTRSEPYTVAADRGGGWKVALEPASNPTVALTLRPMTDLVPDLFSQVFKRAMESLTRPTDEGIPLVLRDEYDRAFAGRTTPEALAAAARDAGLETATIAPRCLGYRRISEPRRTRQVYFALFDAPAFARFRQQIAAGAAAGFEADAQSPVLFIAASDEAFGQWLPLRANPDKDCLAPITAR